MRRRDQRSGKRIPEKGRKALSSGMAENKRYASSHPLRGRFCGHTQGSRRCKRSGRVHSNMGRQDGSATQTLENQNRSLLAKT